MSATSVLHGHDRQEELHIVSSNHNGRNSNLDLLRAAAISMVVIYHGVQMSPVGASGIKHITNYGQYGVDLFFTLSGWLIGSLYWCEKKDFRNVLVGRFWLRRWLRTIPAYLV